MFTPTSLRRQQMALVRLLRIHTTNLKMKIHTSNVLKCDLTWYLYADTPSCVAVHLLLKPLSCVYNVHTVR